VVLACLRKQARSKHVLSQGVHHRRLPCCGTCSATAATTADATKWLV
jgi:hypothetical protein